MSCKHRLGRKLATNIVSNTHYLVMVQETLMSCKHRLGRKLATNIVSNTHYLVMVQETLYLVINVVLILVIKISIRATTSHCNSHNCCLGFR
jgi:hypothetical protein